MRALHQLGLIELADETRVRGAIEHHYRAGQRPMVSEEAWAQAPPIAKQAAVGSALQMIDEYARKSAAEGGFDRREAHLSRTSITVDDKGWEQLNKACLKFVEQVEKIEEGAKEAAKRPARGAAGDAAVVLMAFEAARLSGDEPERAGKRGMRRPPPRALGYTQDRLILARGVAALARVPTGSASGIASARLPAPWALARRASHCEPLTRADTPRQAAKEGSRRRARTAPPPPT